MTSGDNPRCDLCSRPAVVHATEIRDGVTTQRHLCATHAAQIPELASIQSDSHGSPVANAIHDMIVERQAMTGLTANLRGTANFIRRHGRMPRTVAELEEGMSLRPPFPTTDITDPNLRTYLEESDAFLEWFDDCDLLSPPPPDEPPAPQV